MTTSGSKIFRQEALDDQRLKLSRSFSTLSTRGFYLAGGTGLALLLGHRDSIDFDFFCPNNFDVQELIQYITQILGEKNLIIKNTSQNTLAISKNNIQISFMTYPYKTIAPSITTDFFDIASIHDIGAMKLGAIQGRAVNKDYIDLYFIIKQIGLSRLLADYNHKLGATTSTTLLLKYLISFEDVELLPIKMNNNISRTEIQDFLKKEVRKFI